MIGAMDLTVAIHAIHAHDEATMTGWVTVKIIGIADMPAALRTNLLVTLLA